MAVVSNNRLDARRLPSPGCAPEEVERFALTFDGYKVFGSVEALATLDRERRCGTLTELRGRLFFLQRQAHHAGYGLEGAELTSARDILEQIRRRVVLANELLR